MVVGANILGTVSGGTCEFVFAHFYASLPREEGGLSETLQVTVDPMERHVILEPERLTVRATEPSNNTTE